VLFCWPLRSVRTARRGCKATGAAQTSAAVLPDPLTPEAANALISRLSDGEVRALLLDQLNTQAAQEQAENTSGTSEFLYHATTGAWSAVVIPFTRLGDLVSGQARAFSTFYESIGGGRGLLVLLGYMILVYGAGALAELAFRRFTQGWRILPPADPDNMTLRETFQLLGQRFGTQVVAVFVFIIVARLVAINVVPDGFLQVVQMVGIYLIAFPRVMLAVAFFFFAPMNPEYRLLNVSTPAARAFCFHQFWLAMLLGLSGAVILFNSQNGVPPGETRIGFWFNLAMHIYLIAIFWKYRADGVTMMRGADPDVTPAEERAAQAYPYFNIFIFVAVWWIINIVVSYENFDLLRQLPHYKTMILLMFAPAMDTAIRGLVRHLTPAMSGEGPVAEKAYYATKRSYIRIGRVVIFAVVILSIANFWGMSPTAIATAGIGARLAANGMEFLIILSIGYVVYEVVSLFINRKLAAEYTASGYNPDSEEIGGGDGGGTGGSRLSTVLPLILMVSRATIVVIFLLLALGNIGIDTTPLLAGAGIVGLAIGFGAEGTMGTVEKISIRSMQLRHHKGPVHTIPYGEIPKITNFSRDWVIMNRSSLRACWRSTMWAW